MVTATPPTHPAPVTSSRVNGGLFWREDESLKAYLQGAEIVTYDQTSRAGGRPLPVYFRLPENEARQREFPYLVIDQLSWDREVDREMRGPFRLLAADPYCPDGTVPGERYKAQDLPIPIMIRYQIQAWTRFKQQMLWIQNQMALVLPRRFGAINMVANTRANPPTRDDNTVRRMDYFGSVPNESTDPDANANKRLFGRTWTIGISSEILPSDLGVVVTPPVETVVIDLSDRPGYDSVNGSELP